jgi:type IV secretory pathway VirB4 component
MPIIRKKEKMSREQKQAQKESLSAQSLIPIKSLDSGVFITTDDVMVQILKVSSVNLELMSDDEVNEILDNYASFLQSVTDGFMTMNVPQPMDLKEYIKSQQAVLEKDTNRFRRMLMDDYIKYAKNIETSEEIIKRHRYIVISQQLKKLDERGYRETIQSIEDQANDFITGLKEVSLKVEVITDLETVRLFHTFFDFQSARYLPIKGVDVPQIILGGRKDVKPA